MLNFTMRKKVCSHNQKSLKNILREYILKNKCKEILRYRDFISA